MVVNISCAVVFGALLLFAWRAQGRVTSVTEPVVEDTSPHWAQVLLALTFFVCSLAALGFFIQAKTSTMSAILPVSTFGIVFFPVMALSVSSWRKKFEQRISTAPGLYVGCLWLGLLCLLALTAPAGTSTVPLLRDGLIGGLALVLLGTPSVVGQAVRHPFQLALAMLVIWIPIEFDLTQAFRLGSPPAQFDISRVLIYVFGLTLFLIVGRLPNIGYSFVMRRVDFAKASIGLAAFAAIAIPVGLAIGFITWDPEALNLPAWLVRALYIYFCIAIPEELLFRGVIQNMLERHWPQASSAKIGSLLFAAAVFGIAHINNHPVPNWKYVLLSGIAGIVYGWVWQKTRRITASAMTHMAVDWLWVTLFR